MSASLVGSEMCIRDRGPCVLQRSRHPSSALGPLGAPREARRPQDWGSVSYTHLTLPTICSV
eukprot:8228756-Alexandrium_andersonii.AAC.1